MISAARSSVGGALDGSGQQCVQYSVIDGGEVFAHVALQRVLEPPHSILCSLQCPVGTQSGAAGERVVGEPLFEYWFQHPRQRMVDHAVSERRGGNQPWLRIANAKRPVRAGAVPAGKQFVPQFE
jgi:hypothetical protein